MIQRGHPPAYRFQNSCRRRWRSALPRRQPQFSQGRDRRRRTAGIIRILQTDTIAVDSCLQAGELISIERRSQEWPNRHQKDNRRHQIRDERAVTLLWQTGKWRCQNQRRDKSQNGKFFPSHQHPCYWLGQRPVRKPNGDGISNNQGERNLIAEQPIGIAAARKPDAERHARRSANQ